MASYETRKFVDNIIRLVERKGMTRQEFARRLDVRPSYVTKILSGSEALLRKWSKLRCAS